MLAPPTSHPSALFTFLTSASYRYLYFYLYLHYPSPFLSLPSLTSPFPSPFPPSLCYCTLRLLANVASEGPLAILIQAANPSSTSSPGSDVAHPATTAIASVALWNVLHNSEQARALARGAVQDQYHHQHHHQYEYQHEEGRMAARQNLFNTLSYNDTQFMNDKGDNTKYSNFKFTTEGFQYEQQKGNSSLADITQRSRLAVLSLMEC